MWRILPVRATATAFVVLTMLLAAVTWWFRYGGSDAGDVSYIFLVSASAAPMSAFVLLLASSELFWKLCCRFGPKTLRDADITGVWEGESRSTHNALKKLSGVELSTDQMRMTVKQTWWSISVSTDRPNTKVEGKSVASFIRVSDHRPVFFTVFEASNPVATAQDSASWYGFSRFEHFPEHEEIRGVYGSNRAYLLGTPTAGDFVLKRTQ